MFILFGNRALVADNHHMLESTSPYVYYRTAWLLQIPVSGETGMYQLIKINTSACLHSTRTLIHFNLQIKLSEDLQKCNSNKKINK